MRFSENHLSSVLMNEESAPQAAHIRFDWREDLACSRDLQLREIEAYGYVLGWIEKWSRKGAVPHAIVRIGCL